MRDGHTLLKLAERLRENARETRLPLYAHLMLRAARDLETQASDLEAGRPAVSGAVCTTSAGGKPCP